jgi:hypothetical protein
MEFERFLNKYLNGSLSDQETEQFRLLLERFPHYREELRQILDLRSAIQDDALHLTPPEDLSERVRLAVGASFVDARLGDRVVEEKRRRVVWSPYRLAGVAAVIMAVAIPFGPEIFKAGLQKEAAHTGEPVASLTTPSRTSTSVTGSSETGSSETGSSESRAGRQSAERSAEQAPVVSAPAAGVLQSPAISDDIASVAAPQEHVARTASYEDPGGVSSEELPAEGRTIMSSESFAANAVGLPAELSVNQGIFERSGLVDRNIQAMLKPRDIGFSSSYVPAAEAIDHVDDPMLAMSTQYNGQMTVTPGASNRLLTVGVTLGSGQVSNSKNATALLQNSYYFAVSVSKSDRVGIEMGASAFEQVKSVISSVPASAKMGSDFTGFGKRAGTNDPQSIGNHLPTLTGGSGNTLSRGGMMLQIGEYDQMVGSPDNSYRSSNTISPVDLSQTTLVEQRLEQQITYGALFYDRRLEVSNDLDLCARLAVGGANDALVGGVRAYAAFSPTSTLTFTLGVGGSSLYDLTQHKVGASSNYGIYYGIETGF